MSSYRHALFLACLGISFTGCAGGVPPAALQGPPPPLGRNPMVIPAGNYDAVWERVVEVVNDYHFEIARENKLDGSLETEYKVGAGMLELWHPDAVGIENRLEGTLQSIRRRVVVTVRASPGGATYNVGVQAFKEMEDLDGLAANSPGGATFQESDPLNRELNLVVGQSAPSGWIPQGRDPALEQQILARIRMVLGS